MSVCFNDRSEVLIIKHKKYLQNFKLINIFGLLFETDDCQHFTTNYRKK